MNSQLAPGASLVVPATERMLAKAPVLDADELVIDLEDSVPSSAKQDARVRAVTALRAGSWRSRRLSVRVNAPGTPWAHEDLIAVAAVPAVDSVVVPKVESPSDLAFVDRLLDGAERACGRTEPLGVQTLLETAAGIARAQELATSSGRLSALIVGYVDLAASLGRRGSPSLASWRMTQDAVLMAARAAALDAIDGPYPGLVADEAFRAAVKRAVELGFDGKWVIHPGQIDEARSGFSPTSAEIDHARRVVAALERGVREDQGAVALDGEMVDAATVRAAKRTLARSGER